MNSNKTLIVTSPDKGRGVVLLNKDDYIEKMNNILSDPSKFTALPPNTNPHTLILKQEDAVNRFVKQLNDRGILDPAQYNLLRCSGSGLGIMYGLPKVHKDNAPLRPILAAYNTPSYKLAKFLVPILEPLTINDYTVSNSYSFAEYVRSFRSKFLPHIASFDISSLFTNIPLDETIDIICDSIFQSTSLYYGFDVTSFRKILSLACKEMFFLFNNVIYKQVDGVAMGSPLGPTLANIFLSHHEKRWLDSCPPSFKPVIYRRYVDDTFLCFKDPSHIQQFLTFLNNQHTNIKFTSELSSNNSLPFLDCLVSIDPLSHSLSTTVYRKPTFTGLATSYHSFCYSAFKLNSIKTLLHRAYHISTTYFDFHIEAEFLKKLFRDNGYPPHVFEKQLSFFINNIFGSPLRPCTVPKKTVYIPLPYYGNKGEDQYRKLQNNLNNIYPHLNIKIIQKTCRTIANFFPFKDRLPDMLSSDVIYSYTCRDCNALYIGSTCRRAVERFYEHLGKSYRTGRHFSKPSLSHIRNHALDQDHTLSLNDFKIVQSPPPHLLSIYESLHIHHSKPSINAQQTATPLHIIV